MAGYITGEICKEIFLLFTADNFLEKMEWAIAKSYFPGALQHCIASAHMGHPHPNSAR